MKARVLISLAVLCALVIGACFLIPMLRTEKNKEDVPSEPAHEVLVDVSDKGNIVSLSFEKDGKTVYEIERAASGWQYKDRPGLRIDDLSAEELLEPLRVVSAVSGVDSDQLSEFLLDAPAMKLSVGFKEGFAKTFEIGLLNTSKGAYYVRLMTTDPHSYSASGKIWLISEYWVKSFDKSVEALLDTDVLPDFSDVRSVAGVDDAYAREVINCLADLSLLDRVDFGIERYSFYGMNDPLSLTVCTKDGEHSLYVSSDKEFVHLYARVGDSECIYLLSDDSGVLRRVLQNQ